MYKVLGFIVFFSTAFSMGYAKDSDFCAPVHFSDTGWTDITTTTSMTSVILEEILDYKTNIKLLSMPVTLRALKNKEIDIFMGYWYPSHEKSIAPYVKEGSIKVVAENLQGAKYMLAVNDAGFALGIKSYQDIAKYSQQLGSKIYGIDPGNNGNQRILDMIQSDKFSLKNFRLIEASEQASFAQVRRNQKNNIPAVFLSWEPHPINLDLNIHYLLGGEDISGFGKASVYTVVRSDYIDKCPNVGRLLKNIKFSVALENEMMKLVLHDKKDPKSVGRDILRSNPDLLKGWLVGVTRFNGEDPLNEVEKFIKN
ncbi:glycine betaine/proline transport system substrate-binding protein [Candidatus Liberibacter solanacearum]|uniref:Glycine/betaine ABC transporter substrate-binding protein n=1 Tax=Candidatus Liberibacter solanacearum TaxID=556287 RepID=A0A424FMN5_9HYPH|nr:ABC transporter substrate-binding protein [Candidatus Liberibacter solanacearum]RPD37391.1 glycine/betaine ABC transporter substrate-binding protein [Candidatus Liberibacter solanacearum]